MKIRAKGKRKGAAPDPAEELIGSDPIFGVDIDWRAHPAGAISGDMARELVGSLSPSMVQAAADHLAGDDSGIEAWRMAGSNYGRGKTDWRALPLGKMSDGKICQITGIPQAAIGWNRRRLGIPAYAAPVPVAEDTGRARGIQSLVREEEHEEIRAAAERDGLSLSAWVRKVTLAAARATGISVGARRGA